MIKIIRSIDFQNSRKQYLRHRNFDRFRIVAATTGSVPVGLTFQFEDSFLFELNSLSSMNARPSLLKLSDYFYNKGKYVSPTTW